MLLSKSSSYFISQQTPVILSLSKDRVLSQHNLQSFTPVILNSSKDEALIEDNLRRFPRHFDKLSVTLEKERL